MLEVLQDMCQKVPDGSSEFQLRNFVIGSESPGYGRFKQCIMELRSRVNSLERSYIARERTLMDLAELNIMEVPKSNDIGSKDGIVAKRHELNLYEKEIELREIERQIHTLEEEMRILLRISREFPPEIMEVKESQYWEEKFQRNIAINMALGQPLSTNLVEAVLNMPEGSEIKEWMESSLERSQEKVEEIEPPERLDGDGPR